jgi:hypothetical protein
MHIDLVTTTVILFSLKKTVIIGIPYFLGVKPGYPLFIGQIWTVEVKEERWN